MEKKRIYTRRAAIGLMSGLAVMALSGCMLQQPQQQEAAPVDTGAQQEQSVEETKPDATGGAVSSDIKDAIPASEATEDNPAAIGQWVEISQYSTADDAYHTVYARVTGVSMDQADVESAVAKNNELATIDWDVIDLSQVNLPSDVKMGILTYEVYIPGDFPKGDNDYVTEPSLSFSESNIGGGGIPSADGSASYIGLGSNNTDLNTDSTNSDTVYAVDSTYEFKQLFTMVDGYTGYVFDITTYPDGTTSDGTSADDMLTVCFACE